MRGRSGIALGRKISHYRLAAMKGVTGRNSPQHLLGYLPDCWSTVIVDDYLHARHWLGELAFANYWRVLEEHCPGLVKAPEFSHMSLAERQAWAEAAKAVAEHIRDDSCVASEKMTPAPAGGLTGRQERGFT